jgi:hypothetical protein
MDTPAAAVDYGCKVSTKHGAIHIGLNELLGAPA